MAFKKGQSGNLKGKPKGTKSEKTVFWDGMKDWFMQDGAERFKRELETLKGTAYVIAYSNTLEFFKPKLSRTEVKHEGEIKATMKIVGIEPPNEL